jgi:hypothetical protein
VGLFSPFEATWRIARLDRPIPAATVTVAHHRTPTNHAAAFNPFFQATTDRSNFLQQNVAKLNLRHQYGLRRTARSQQVET